MNVVSRGIKNAFRSPLRSGAIIVMLSVSVGLILSMLVARSSVNARVNEVKSNSGTNITISPAGIQGFEGGGSALTTAQLATIKSISHITDTTSTLRDQMQTTDTNLSPSLELGSFGARQQRLENSDTTSSNTATTSRPTPTPRTSVTGTTDSSVLSTSGGQLNITSGIDIDGNSSDLVALVGSDLAAKNSLTVGKTFTAYGKTITVKGIFKTDNKFQDSGLIMPLATVQNLTSQSGAISGIIVKVDSSDNVTSTVNNIKTKLGSDKVDVVSQAEQAANSVSSLESISSLALTGVVASAIAGAVIILLAMVMIVRERQREIGVIKAIGGTNTKVIFQFITEALTITIIGSIVGLALGIAVSGPMTTSLVNNSTASESTQNRPGGGPGGFMSRGLGQINSNVNQVAASLTPQIFASAVGITLLIAIVGSAAPAWLIARVSPAEVLRSE
ncbi:FtsX-like permease family protein [Candidatus Saccharibacteria bacterium]|nr:FtsX-like permease family protein [Candidatus Saccharibacteria bacterium]